MSTDASGGGLDLETVYNAATPVSWDDSNQDPTLDADDSNQDPTLDVDESEEAPLIGNIN